MSGKNSSNDGGSQVVIAVITYVVFALLTLVSKSMADSGAPLALGIVVFNPGWVATVGILMNAIIALTIAQGIGSKADGKRSEVGAAIGFGALLVAFVAFVAMTLPYFYLFFVVSGGFAVPGF